VTQLDANKGAKDARGAPYARILTAAAQLQSTGMKRQRQHPASVAEQVVREQGTAVCATPPQADTVVAAARSKQLAPGAERQAKHCIGVMLQSGRASARCISANNP